MGGVAEKLVAIGLATIAIVKREGLPYVPGAAAATPH
jgi:hypothetical protein